MKASDRLFLSMVAVLPLHTVFFQAWIAWKPYLVVLAVLVLADVAEGLRGRRWPWNRQITVALGVFVGVVLLGLPAAEYRERFFRLGLAIVVGGLVMLVSERRLHRPGMIDSVLRVAYWTGAGMGATAVLLSLVMVGALGEGIIASINEIPGVFRFFKPAYLESGFLALSNWHQDPGYGAAWAVLWAVLVLFASLRGLGSGRWYVDGLVVGGLGFAVTMAFSRTGWLAFPLAQVLAWAVLRRQVSFGWLVRRWGVAALTVVALLAVVTAVDVEGRGGDVDLQFAFRFSQGWDLLADLTGWFESSEEFADRFEPGEERADVWPEYLDLFRAHPWMGVGLSVGWQTNSIGQEPHNLLIELLAETGLVGLAAFLLLLAAITRRGSDALGAAALMTAFLPSLTQTVLFEPTWWFAAALFLAGKDSGVEPDHG